MDSYCFGVPWTVKIQLHRLDRVVARIPLYQTSAKQLHNVMYTTDRCDHTNCRILARIELETPSGMHDGKCAEHGALRRYPSRFSCVGSHSQSLTILRLFLLIISMCATKQNLGKGRPTVGSLCLKQCIFSDSPQKFF